MIAGLVEAFTVIIRKWQEFKNFVKSPAKKFSSLVFLIPSCQPKQFGRAFSLTVKPLQNSTLCLKK